MAEVALKHVQITTKDVSNLVFSLFDNRVRRFAWIDVSFEKIWLWIKCFQTVSHSTEKSFAKWKHPSVWQISLLSILRHWLSHPNFRNHHSGQIAAINIRKRPCTTKSFYEAWWLSVYFSNKAFQFRYRYCLQARCITHLVNWKII